MATTKKTAKKKKIYVSSVTGRRVTEAFAKANPDTTYSTTQHRKKKSE